MSHTCQQQEDWVYYWSFNSTENTSKEIKSFSQEEAKRIFISANAIFNMIGNRIWIDDIFLQYFPIMRSRGMACGK